MIDFFSPQANYQAISGAVRLFSQRRSLVLAMTVRDLKDRYAGQALGAAWAVLTPLLTMGVYLFVFTFIFRGRYGEDATGAGFIAYALSGLAPWLALQEGLSRSVSAVSGNSNLIKQIVFPSEILPLKTALATLPTLFIGLACAVGATFFAHRASVVGLLVLLPFCIATYVVFLAGLSFFLSAVGVYFRDLKDVVAFFLSIGLFLHPILYAPGAGPAWLEKAFAFSPISHLIWCFHGAIVGHDALRPNSLFIFPALSLVIFLLGWRIFRWLKPTFGNAL